MSADYFSNSLISIYDTMQTYLKLTSNALQVLESRYLLKNSKGEIIETPEQLFKRVAHHVAKAEDLFCNQKNKQSIEHDFYTILTELKFLPNSPTLMNAGTSIGQMSACFVLPITNNKGSMTTTLNHISLIQKSGGGTGFNFSALNPIDTTMRADSLEKMDPISFMKRIDAFTNDIKQGGKRRGANMGVLNINHPNIEDFIKAKHNSKTLKNFNISVGVTDVFMEAVIQNDDFELIHPSSGKTTKILKARNLWKSITYHAWLNGEPGLLFIDTINRANPISNMGKIECTNPCGEVPLFPFEACNLGSIDVAKFINNQTKSIEWTKLQATIFTAIRFLDNVIEINDYLLPEIRETVYGNRKIGLGVMGWANLLIQMDIPYASPQAVELAHKLMSFINETSKNASEQLAEERGVFLNWKKSMYYPNHKFRHATRTCIAPTGTISIIANTSPSIEPLFALTIRREHVLGNDTTLTETNPYVIDYFKSTPFYSYEVLEQIEKTGSIINCNLPDHIKNLFKTATEIEAKWHILHQIAFQNYTDNAVSKTINFPKNATIKDISNAYLKAWMWKLKGITAYRNESNEQVIYRGSKSFSCMQCDV